MYLNAILSVGSAESHQKPTNQNLQGDGMTWEIHLGTRLRVKVVPP